MSGDIQVNNKRVSYQKSFEPRFGDRDFDELP